MIVTCPNCQTRYNLPDEKVPAKGAKVKCSKCTHVFKTPPPQAMPEDEVESLFEQESASPDTRAGERFDETFEEVASAGAAHKGAAPKDAADEFPAPPEEPGGGDDEMPGMDDLFDDDDTSGGAGLFDDEETGDESHDAPGQGASEDAADDLFEESDADADDLFARDDEEGGEEADDDDEDDGAGFGLDDEPVRKGSRSLGCLIVILVLALGLGAAVYFKAWTLIGIDPAAYFQNVPYLGRLFMEPVGDRDAAPGESPADRVRRIELKNVKQYYVANEKTGNIFVVEGKAVNAFSTPKERIRVEVVLYDKAGTVLASQALLCGNVLSQFQLQVQTQKEIEDGLASEVGILSNNTFIRPGSSTPFMAVFFQPPANVKEFLVKVVDVGDPS